MLVFYAILKLTLHLSNGKPTQCRDFSINMSKITTDAKKKNFVLKTVRQSTALCHVLLFKLFRPHLTC